METGEGDETAGTGDGEASSGQPGSNSIEDLVAKLKAMQKSRHTLDLVCDIFSDFRVRKLGHM